MAQDIRLKKFKQVLPSLPVRDIDGNKIPNTYTEKKTLWGWFFPIEEYWTIPQTQEKLNELEIKIYQSIDWKETVSTYSEIATKYPTPAEGWTVSVSDSNTIYRYDAQSGSWIKLFESSTELASAVRNGLMSSGNFSKLAGIEDQANKYIHPSTHPATMITTDPNNRFVSDALINAWNGLVTFPGFAGTGGYFGTYPTAARYDHGHQFLHEVEQIQFKAAISDYTRIFTDTTTGDVTKFIFELSDNAAHNGGDEWIFRAINTTISTNDVLRINQDGLYHMGVNLADRSWDAITNKPRYLSMNQFTAAWGVGGGFSFTNDSGQDTGMFSDADGDLYFMMNGVKKTSSWVGHTHPVSDISGLSLDWSAITGKPGSFNPSAHTHSEYVPKTGGTFTGYVDFLGGAGNSGSDMRYKNRLSHSIEKVLPNIVKLNIFDYIWNKSEEPNYNTFGVSATQLIEIGGIFGKIVHERPDENKTQWVEYDRFGIIALKGIQELSDQLSEMKIENEKLKKAIIRLANIVDIDLSDVLR